MPRPLASSKPDPPERPVVSPARGPDVGPAASGLKPQASDTGISLDRLNEAFARLLDEGQDPYQNAIVTEDAPAAPAHLKRLGLERTAAPAEADACPISPRSILEAVLFVGDAENRPVSSREIAGMMRGVRAAEIDDHVRELNEIYAAQNRPYTIVSIGAGYRLTLRPQYGALRENFYGKARQARLSQAAIEVLALVAYNQPTSGEQVAKLRGAPAGHVLAQLVRRQLVRIDRPSGKRTGGQYWTTPRFLKLFGLASLDDLPRSEQFELDVLE